MALASPRCVALDSKTRHDTVCSRLTWRPAFTGVGHQGLHHVRYRTAEAGSAALLHTLRGRQTPGETLGSEPRALKGSPADEHVEGFLKLVIQYPNIQRIDIDVGWCSIYLFILSF